MKNPYFRLLLLALLFTAPRLLSAQGFGLPPGFDLKTFQKNEEQAIWFLQCDSAWQYVTAFDPAAASKDFICIPDKRGWKVVAGNIDSAGFKSDAVYYQVDLKNVVTVAKKKTDTVLVAAMARALFNSSKAIAKLTVKPAGGWKRYVKVNPDLSITVWAFCDSGPSGEIFYGPECAWYYASNGTQLVTSKIVNKPPVAAVKTGRSMNLTCAADKMPSPGTIWLAHRNKKSFDDINVTYKTGTSTLRFNAAEKTYAWEHVAN
jgi:hypothetical protein